MASWIVFRDSNLACSKSDLQQAGFLGYLLQMKRLVFWAGCSRLWVRVVFLCKVWSLSLCIFSFSWLTRTALSQRRHDVDRVVFSNNLPGTEQWKEVGDFIYS